MTEINTGVGTIYNEINGTDGDDRGDDRLVGTGGRDLIFDGAGRDAMRGGAGADIFKLAADSTRDKILDFTQGEDMIDLSLWGVTSISELTIRQDKDHVKISYGGELLELRNTLASELNTDDFVFAPIDPLVGIVVVGSDEDDRGSTRLSGRDGQDQITDGSGHDELLGGADADLFILVADGDKDEILDFENGVDQIDLGAWGVREISELSIQQNNADVHISYHDELLELRDAQASDLDADDFLFASQGGYASSYNEIDGTTGDDRGDTRLTGTDGSDLIFDGAGRDVMRGGAGADIFKLAADSTKDDILDFTQGEDVIDLSLWGVSNISELTIRQDKDHVKINYGSELLELRNFIASDLTNDDFVLI
jgi:Ca2+-binding RTX toxin-like protein